MRKISFFLLVAILVASSCNNSTKPADNTVAKQDSISKATQPAAPAADNDVDLLPNLLQIGAIFKNAELSYSANLMAEIKEVAHLSTFYEQAVHMGIYSADLSYATVNKQKDAVSKYMKSVKDLSDAIGLGSIFSADKIAKRFEDNMNNDDSLTSILGDLQIKMDDMLTKNKQNNVRVIIYSGAWAESMHIATKVYIKDKTANASTHIVEQITILENILKVMEKYKDSDPHIASLYKDMKDIDNSYNAFDEVKNYNSSSGKGIALTPEHIAQIGDAVEKIRENIEGK